jgi:hypothetical protein
MRSSSLPSAASDKTWCRLHKRPRAEKRWPKSTGDEEHVAARFGRHIDDKVGSIEVSRVPRLRESGDEVKSETAENEGVRFNEAHGVR